MKQTFYVTFKVEGRYEVEVEAENIEGAIKEARSEFSDAYFGELQDIDGEEIIIANEKEDHVWEK